MSYMKMGENTSVVTLDNGVVQLKFSVVIIFSTF